MKTKFETNVASQMPKTKSSQEPALPWKIDSADLEKIAASEGEYNSTLTGTPPLKVRAVFLILMIVAVFGSALYFATRIVNENEKISIVAKQKEEAVSTLQADLSKVAGEKNTLNESIGGLQKRINELNSQKDLFTAVIESLTKKDDEAILMKDKQDAVSEAPVQQPAQAPAEEPKGP